MATTRRRKIRYVDGFAIRNVFPDMDIIESHSTTGDWRGDLPTPFVPEGEIWIDRRFKRETRFILKVFRASQTKKGWKEAQVRAWLKTKFTKKGVPPPFVARSERHGRLTVRYVRGEVVRRYFDPWFIFGGHDLVYDYVPKNEVWIDIRQDPREIPYTLFHELYERRLMRGGTSYPDAHKQATEKERVLRSREFAGRKKLQPLRIKPHRQAAGFCGPASLKIVLSYFGREYEEKYLGDLCGTTAANGTEHAGMIACAKAVGASVFEKENGTVEELRYFVLKRRLPVIVGWYSPSEPGKTAFVPGRDEVEDHFSVIYHVTDDYVLMMDPERDSGRRKVPLARFRKLWWDSDTPENVRVDRWYMVINVEGKAFNIPGGRNH